MCFRCEVWEENFIGAGYTKEKLLAGTGPSPVSCWTKRATMPQRSDKGTRLLDGDDGTAPHSTPQPSAVGGQAPDVQAIQAQVDSVRDTMRENVNVMVENIERGSNLEARSADLANQARAFHQTTRQTARAMWWQQCKQKLICWGAIITAIVVLSLIIAGSSGAFDNKPSPPSPTPA